MIRAPALRPPTDHPLMKKNKQEEGSIKINRREFSLGSGAFTMAFLLGDGVINLTPAEAKTRKIPFRSLDQKQVSTLDFLSDAIVPGAKSAGLSHFIDHQLSAAYEDNLLILRYLRVNPPFKNFYASALKAFERSVRLKYNKSPLDLSEAEISEFISIMMQNNPAGWPETEQKSEQGPPPAPFFYFVLRSDAIDVTYGTMSSFDSMDIPYMAHIAPSHPWEAPS